MSAAHGPDLSPAVVRGLEAQAGRLRERTAAGERRVGWKIALNDARVQAALGISAPVIGYLATGTVVTPGAPHSLAGAARAAIEPEIAVYVGEEREVAALGAALEVIDVDLPFEDLGAILERNVFHRAVVLGPPVMGAAGLEGLTARMTRDGTEEAAIDVARSALDPGEVLRLVGGYLEAVGESLVAGDIIIAGSLTAALPVNGEERVELHVDGMAPVALELRSA